MSLDVSKPPGLRKAWQSGINLTRMVTVCDSCRQASCWQGIFMCWESRDAGTTTKTVAELRALGRETR